MCPLSIKTKNHSIQQLHMHRQTAMQPPSHPKTALGRLRPQHTWAFCLLQKSKLPRISLLGLLEHFSKLENKFLYINCSDNLEGISYWIVNHYCIQVPVDGMVPSGELHGYVLMQNYHETSSKVEHGTVLASLLKSSWAYLGVPAATLLSSSLFLPTHSWARSGSQPWLVHCWPTLPPTRTAEGVQTDVVLQHQSSQPATMGRS